MSNYMDKVAAITGHRRALARVAQGAQTVLGSSASPEMGAFLTKVRGAAPAGVTDSAPAAIAGALAGAYVGQKNGGHWLLGTAAGGYIGNNVPALFRVDERREALCNIGVMGAATAGSLLMQDNKFLGFLLGLLAGGAVVHFGGLRK